MKYLTLVWLALFVFHLQTQAQEELLDEIASDSKGAAVLGTFNANTLVYLPTNETAGKGEILINIIHRFGPIGGTLGGIDAFWGLDFVQDVRLAMYYGISDRLHVGVGRSKFARRVDLEAKYKLLEQRLTGLPFSLTVMGNAAIGTEPNDVVAGPASNFDQNVQLYPDFASRVSYLLALPIARKFGEGFSMTLVPMWLHRNYLTARLDEHDIFALGVGTRLALSSKFALTAEYVQTLSSYRLYKVDDTQYYPPLAVGFEVVAGGHVFQVSLSNTKILPNEYLVNSTESWAKSEMQLGFNIVRSIGLGNRNLPYPTTPAPEAE